MSSKSFYKSNRCCIIITGASKGFGRTLSIKFAQSYRNHFPQSDPNDVLIFVLIARNEHDLKTLSNELKSIDSRCNSVTIVADLSQEDSIETFENFFKVLSNEFYGHFILVHNAGSTGNSNQLCKDVIVNDARQRDSYYRLNLYSVMELTGVFLRLSPNTTKHIINISSLAAIKPFKGLLDYCVGKAAREAYFKQLVDEVEGLRTFRILNYAPGPLDTDMFRFLQNEGILKKQFQDIIPLKPEDSADKLLRLLNEDQFENGAHVDFYDID